MCTRLVNALLHLCVRWCLLPAALSKVRAGMFILLLHPGVRWYFYPAAIPKMCAGVFTLLLHPGVRCVFAQLPYPRCALMRLSRCYVHLRAGVLTLGLLQQHSPAGSGNAHQPPYPPLPTTPSHTSPMMLSPHACIIPNAGGPCCSVLVLQCPPPVVCLY